MQFFPCKTHFPEYQEEPQEVPGADEETKRHLHRQFLENLANPAKTIPGIIVRQRHTDQKRMGLLRRAVRRVKEGTSAALLQSGLDKEWWADSMECYCFLRNILDLLSDGKTLSERRFGELFFKDQLFRLEQCRI